MRLLLEQYARFDVMIGDAVKHSSRFCNALVICFLLNRIN